MTRATTIQLTDAHQPTGTNNAPRINQNICEGPRSEMAATLTIVVGRAC